MRTVIFIFLAVVLSAFYGLGDVLRAESFQLQEGWNAVFLSVDPVSSDPADVFAGSSVDVVATFDGAGSFGQFSTNPGVDKLRLLGWAIWYAPAREDAFLSTISSIQGNTPYLVHATEAVTLVVEGEMVRHDIEWTPNAFNLVGFTLDATAPPTFEQFFNASPAHRGQSIYRMADGVWVQVQNPVSTLMKNGEAFWIYCNGSSNFEGPLSVEGGTDAGLLLQGDAEDLVLRNEASHPVLPVLEHVVAGAEPVPLAVVVQVVGEENQTFTAVPVAMADGSWSQELPVLEPGGAIRLPLQMRSDALVVDQVESLLCIKTDLGTETWIPVKGIREELK